MNNSVFFIKGFIFFFKVLVTRLQVKPIRDESSYILFLPSMHMTAEYDSRMFAICSPTHHTQHIGIVKLRAYIIVTSTFKITFIFYFPTHSISRNLVTFVPRGP